MSPDTMLMVAEVARELRCSTAHVYKVIRGKVAGVPTLPAIAMGRKLLVRRTALERWKRLAESGGGIVDEVAEVNAVLRIQGDIL